jgi:hypothetical protein
LPRPRPTDYDVFHDVLVDGFDEVLALAVTVQRFSRHEPRRVLR